MARANIDSPKNIRPSATPYRPPTSSPSIQVSIETREAARVQFAVRRDDIRRDPGAGFVRARRGARVHDGFERAVGANFDAVAARLRRRVLPEVRDTRNSSVNSTMRGSGDHHSTGSPSEYQGKMPCRYASISRSIVRSRLAASRPLGCASAVRHRRKRLPGGQPGNHAVERSGGAAHPRRWLRCGCRTRRACGRRRSGAAWPTRCETRSLAQGISCSLNNRTSRLSVPGGESRCPAGRARKKMCTCCTCGTSIIENSGPRSTRAPASSSVSRSAPSPVVSPISMNPAGSVHLP